MLTPEDFGSQMRDAVDGAALGGPPPVDEITTLASHRNQLRRRRLLVGSVVAAVVLAGALSLSALIPGGGQSAQAGEIPDDTYVLSDFGVTYPYRASPAAPTDQSSAGVTFHANWASETRPGISGCQILALDGSGTVVGQLNFDAEYDTPSADAPIMAVPVTAPPASAQGYCGVGSSPSGPGYEFTVEGVTSAGGRTVVDAVANWVGEEDPGWRSCSLTVASDSGAETHEDMSIVVADGTAFRVYADSPQGGAAGASIVCTDPN